MAEPRGSTDLYAFSEQLADAVQTAAASTVRVAARRGPPASGIAFASDLILTADHAVESDLADEPRVGLTDGREVRALLVGRDPSTDLAVLRLADGGLLPATPAAEEPRVGSLALAVARPGREPASSLALISSLEGPLRTLQRGMLTRAILVDAVLYPGFSGGPLIDPRGAVLGMNTSGLGHPGTGVAVPWQLAMQLAAAIAEHGRVTRGYVGIGVQPLQLEGSLRDLAEGQERGLLVVHVAGESPAARAGFLQGDILINLDGTAVPGVEAASGTFHIRVNEPPEPGLPPSPPGSDVLLRRGVRRLFRGGGVPDREMLPFTRPLPPPPPGPGAEEDVLWWRGPRVRPFEAPPPADAPQPRSGPFFIYHRVGAMDSVDELQGFLGPERVGATLVATVIRGGALHELQVTVAPQEETRG